MAIARVRFCRGSEKLGKNVITLIVVGTIPIKHTSSIEYPKVHFLRRLASLSSMIKKSQSYSPSW